MSCCICPPVWAPPSPRIVPRHITEDYARFARTMVSDVHDAAEDREAAGMISDLRAISAWFAELWDVYAVIRQVSERKTCCPRWSGP